MAVALRSATVAAPAPTPVRAPAPARRRRRAAPRRGVLRGVLSIAVLAALLAGVVALNVAVLDLNVQLDRVSRERSDLRAENAELESQLSRAVARVGPAARSRLGLVLAEETTFVELGK